MPKNEFSFTFYKDGEKVYENTYHNLESKKNIFQFSLFDYNTTIDLNSKTFTRENDDFIFSLNFLDSTSQIFLKKENLNLPIEVDYCEIYEKNNQIVIEYSIETEDSRITMEINKGDL